MLAHVLRFQSTLSVRRATRIHSSNTKILLISIHALRKESDARPCGRGVWLFISIHALRKESDYIFANSRWLIPFQSTLSVRRATCAVAFRGCCGAISIHALRKESDRGAWSCEKDELQFQSTLSVRRATSTKAARRRDYQHFNPRSP